jgi:hypothetical protein
MENTIKWSKNRLFRGFSKKMSISRKIIHAKLGNSKKRHYLYIIIIHLNTRKMKSADQILDAKGYDYDEQNDIINFKSQFSEEGLDMQVRKEYSVEEPIHLWADYAVGDANEDVLLQVAKQNGFEDVESLLDSMTKRLNSLCDDIPEKIDWFPAKMVEEIRIGNTVVINKYGDLFEESLTDVSDEDLENAIRNYHEIEGL